MADIAAEAGSEENAEVEETEESALDNGAEAEAGKEGSEESGSEDTAKKTIAKVRGEVKEERRLRREAEAELQKLRDAAESKDKPETEAAIERARKEGETAASKKFMERLLKSDIKTEAKGKLNDPEDALSFLKLDDFEADANGNFDPEEIAEAISDLLVKRPYLGTAKQPTVTYDNGKGKSAPKGQYTKEQADAMTPEAYMDAYKAGRLKAVVGK